MSTNKAWIQRVLAHTDGQKVPYNFSFSPPALARVAEYYGTTDIFSHLNFPVRMTGLRSIKPLYAPPAEFGETVTDEFGVVWSTSTIDRGSPIGHALTEDSLDHYTFPDPTMPYRYEGLADWCQVNREHFTIVWVGDLWERATFMRGMEGILFDIALNPEFVTELLERLADNIIRTMDILFTLGEFDAIAVSDDYGSQKGLLMSPDMWREIIKPPLARIYAHAKKYNRAVFHHSCGHLAPVIRDMIDIGLDILHPIQPEAMDVLALKREFGNDVTFCGGIPTQELLPLGTPDAVRAEVRRLKSTLGVGGGYILEPGITIQDDVPLENIVAMMEEAQRD